MRGSVASVADGSLEVAALLAVGLYLGIAGEVQVVVAGVGGVLGIGGFNDSNIRGRGEPGREGARFEASVCEEIDRHDGDDWPTGRTRDEVETVKQGGPGTLYCLIEEIPETRLRKRLFNWSSSAGPNP